MSKNLYVGPASRHCGFEAGTSCLQDDHKDGDALHKESFLLNLNLNPDICCCFSKKIYRAVQLPQHLSQWRRKRTTYSSNSFSSATPESEKRAYCSDFLTTHSTQHLFLQSVRNYVRSSCLFNPLDARRRYTDFAQTSIRAGLRYTVQIARCHTRRQTVYLRYGT